MSRFVVVVFLLFTSLAVGVNSVSAVDGDPLTVTYDSGGGSSVADTASTVGGTVADPGVPSRLGYRFDGWSLGATPTAISAGVSHSCALLAGGTVTCWGNNDYSQVSGAAGVTSATAVSAGLNHSCALLADKTVTCWGGDAFGRVSGAAGVTNAIAISSGGYHSCALLAGGTVTCWGDDGSGQSTVPASLTTAISSWPYTHGQTSDFTVYARWSANTLAVTYDSGGGSSVASSFTSTGGIVTPIVRPTRAGYTWAGWYSAATGGTPVYLARPHGRTSDFTLYARWTANRLIVTYDTGGGSGISSSTARTGGTAWYPGRPTRAGYTFVGWYTAASGGVRVTYRYTHGRTSDFTLYARWTANLV